ncbi:MAG: M23 family metallopeptidase [Prevotella sp.]|nr:M23 family metallopeptidase [Prevotella sp.]
MSIISIVILAAALQFGSPVHFPITLAGNFGEPRPNHFHGGIDVCTESAVGKPLFSIGEGYVSRVTVGLYGFGNAVYIQHPNGKTSVYCHLKDFPPFIRQEVTKYRLAHGQKDRIDEWHNPSEPADLYFRPMQLPVAKGQLIAISGNTGSSVAPHLHLEIHDTDTWAMRDPLDELKDCITDHTPPQAHAFMAYPQQGEGIFCHSDKKQLFGFSSNHLEREFTAWGKVGFGLWANDYMEGTYHHYGIRKTELIVDGKCVFTSDVDSIPAHHNRVVNAWGDFYHYLRSNVWYMKSFIDPGNSLPILKADESRGIVNFNEERTYQIVYVLTDAFGNQSTYSFQVRGTKEAITKRQQPVTPMLYWNRVNNFQLPGMQLLVRRWQVADDMPLKPDVRIKAGALSDAYRFTDIPASVFNGAQLSIRLKRKVADNTKLCIRSGDRNFGGTYHDGWVTTEIRDLGLYYEIGYNMPENKNQIKTDKIV